MVYLIILWRVCIDDISFSAQSAFMYVQSNRALFKLTSPVTIYGHHRQTFVMSNIQLSMYARTGIHMQEAPRHRQMCSVNSVIDMHKSTVLQAEQHVWKIILVDQLDCMWK